MFNPRQLLVHTLLLRTALETKMSDVLTDQVLGGIQQYLRNQNMFCIWNIGADKLEPFFSNSNYAPKVRCAF